MFLLLFESSIRVAMPPAHDPETAHHENEAWPAPSLSKVNTSKRICPDCDTIAASISSLVDVPDKTFSLRISANPAMPEKFSATATLQFRM